MKLILSFSVKKFYILRRNEFDVANLYEHFEPEMPPYHYFILRKNRITINHKYIDFTDNLIKTEFIIQNKDELVKEQLNYRHDYKGLQEVKVVSEYPYNQFEIVDEEGSRLLCGKAAYYPEHELFYNQVKNKELLDYEILYIGQSVLSKNKIPVVDRISKHSTFQKILQDNEQYRPDTELFSFFFSFKQDALLDIAEEFPAEDQLKFNMDFIPNYLNPSNKWVKQNVSLLEAALINYFKPKYNDKFVKYSPSKKHSSFGGVCNLNLSKVSILFGLENFHPRFYTDEVGRKSEHIIEYKIE